MLAQKMNYDKEIVDITEELSKPKKITKESLKKWDNRAFYILIVAFVTAILAQVFLGWFVPNIGLILFVFSGLAYYHDIAFKIAQVQEQNREEWFEEWKKRN
jgi:fatty acid desaturase